MIFNIIITIIIIIIIIIILKSFFKLKSLLILLEPKIVSHFRYFRGTISVDLDVPLSFPVFILSLFCDKLICNDLNCTLSHIVNFLRLKLQGLSANILHYLFNKSTTIFHGLYSHRLYLSTARICSVIVENEMDKMK